MRRNATLFVGISLLSGFSGNAMLLVLGIWVLDLTGSGSLAALAGLGVYAPQLAGPWLGALLDRVPRRALVVGASLVRAGVLLGLVGVRGTGQVWLIYAVTLAYGVGYVLLDAGETALLPAALPVRDLATVNGWRSSAQEGMKLVAPAAGAGLYAWWGGPTVAVLSAALSATTAVLYAAVRLAPTRPDSVPSRRGGALRTALVILRQRPEAGATVALAAVVIAMSGFQIAAVYSLVTQGLRLPAAFLGVLGSVQGAGSILGGLFAGRLIRLGGPARVGATGAVLFAAGCLARCLPWWPALLGAALLTGAGLPWTLIAAVTAVQTQTPPEALGRVAATTNTMMFGPIAVAIPLGSAAAHLGGRPPLLAAALACLAAAALVAPAGTRAAISR